MRDLFEHLRLNLQKQADGLYSADNVGENAKKRITRLVEASPAVICFLAEPWLGAGITVRQEQILMHCASLHLYSRVLDDAIDEGEACQKEALLRAQPLFWQAVYGLATLVPHLAEAGQALISETVRGVLANDASPAPCLWGEKNCHLLLIPLFLGDDADFFEQSRAHLRAALGLLQAWDELVQGSCRQTGAFCSLITDAMRDDVPWLDAHGWKMLASRLCLESRHIINALQFGSELGG